VIHEQLSTIEDRDAWEEAMPAHISVFGSIGYARIVQRHIGYPARLFVVSSGAGRIVYPFFLRPVANLPFAKQYAPFWDSLTPEYTGPMAWGEVTPLLRYFFNERWNRLCEEQGIVAEFAHLHPSERAADLLDSAHVQFNREIVVVDLTLPEEELLRHSFSLSCRNNIRRAQREQVRVVEGRTDADVREFHRIYTMTMERRQAHKRYFFSLDYFLAFRDELPDNTLFLFAVHRDRAIAAHLYLYDDEEMHDFLGGMEEEHKQLRPVNAIIYAAIQWGRRHGKRRLILGGGVSAERWDLSVQGKFLSAARTLLNVSTGAPSDAVCRPLPGMDGVLRMRSAAGRNVFPGVPYDPAAARRIGARGWRLDAPCIGAQRVLQFEHESPRRQSMPGSGVWTECPCHRRM